MGTSTTPRRRAAALLVILGGPLALLAAPQAGAEPVSYTIHADVVRVSPRYGWHEVSEPVRQCVNVAAPHRFDAYPRHGHRPPARFDGYRTHDRAYSRDYDESFAYRRADRRQGGEVAAGLVGGLIGGLIGNQFGGGNGRTALTVAGAMLGASVAGEHLRRSRTRVSTVHGYVGAAPDYALAPRATVRCTESYRTRQVRGIDGYDVSYRYQGRTFTKWMDRHPGDTVPVRVAMEPLE